MLMGIKKRFILFLLLFLAGTQTVLFSLDIYLKDFAQFTADILYVRDIATIQDTDNDIKAALLSLPLPLPANRIQIISAYTLKKLIEKHYNGAFVVIGKKSVCIPSGVVPQDSMWFFKRLIGFFLQNDPDSTGRIELESLTLPSLDYLTPLPDLRFGFLHKETSNGFIAGRVKLKGYSDRGKGDFSCMVEFYVHRYISVAVPIRTIMKHERLYAAQLEFVQKDISGINDDVLLEIMPFDRYLALVTLPIGQTISLANLKMQYVINSGDAISILFTRSGIRVTARGRARQSGFIGNQIQVTAMDTQKTFLGTILNEKGVIVELE
jgi:flagella basal body P-ring formation protein FlgA